MANILGVYAHSSKIWNQNTGRLSKFSLEADSLAFSQSILVPFPPSADSFVMDLWNMSTRSLIGRYSFFTKEGKTRSEVVVGKTVRKRNISFTLSGSRLVLRVNIFKKVLQICKADLSFCGEVNIEKDLKSLGNMQASFLFYSYDKFNSDGHCDTRKDPYKCVPSQAGIIFSILCFHIFL